MSEIFIATILFIIIWTIVIYNRLVSNKNRAYEGWSGIDVQLKRRHILIPNLVTTTKQYAKFEQAVLTTVTELRSQSGRKMRSDPRCGFRSMTITSQKASSIVLSLSLLVVS